MKTLRLIPALLVAVVLSVPFPMGVGAAGSDSRVAPGSAPSELGNRRYALRGLVASVGFDSYDPTGCINTYVDVTASDTRSHQGGKPVGATGMYLRIHRYDHCEGRLLVDAGDYVALAEGALRIDPGLASAELNASVELFDYASGSPLPVQVHLAWAAVDSPPREHYHYQEKYLNLRNGAGYTEIRTGTGVYQYASVTGSISDGSREFASTPPGWAWLSRLRSGSIEIAR